MGRGILGGRGSMWLIRTKSNCSMKLCSTARFSHFPLVPNMLLSYSIPIWPPTRTLTPLWPHADPTLTNSTRPSFIIMLCNVIEYPLRVIQKFAEGAPSWIIASGRLLDSCRYQSLQTAVFLSSCSASRHHSLPASTEDTLALVPKPQEEALQV